MLRCVGGGIQYGDRYKILRIGYVDFLYLATFLLCREKEHRHLPGRGDGDAFWIIFLLYYFTSMPIMLYFLLSLMMRIWPFSYTFCAFD